MQSPNNPAYGYSTHSLALFSGDKLEISADFALMFFSFTTLKVISQRSERRENKLTRSMALLDLVLVFPFPICAPDYGTAIGP